MEKKRRCLVTYRYCLLEKFQWRPKIIPRNPKAWSKTSRSPVTGGVRREQVADEGHFHTWEFYLGDVDSGGHAHDTSPKYSDLYHLVRDVILRIEACATLDFSYK